MIGYTSLISLYQYLVSLLFTSGLENSRDSEKFRKDDRKQSLGQVPSLGLEGQVLINTPAVNQPAALKH